MRIATAEGPRFRQDGVEVGGTAGRRMAEFLDLVSATYDPDTRLRADVTANFPVGAGLASSAAIFCAVAAAAVSTCGGRISREDLSGLARRGSGSAARSVYGGLVEWRRGERGDGSDSIAIPIESDPDWSLGMAVAIVSEAKKAFASRDAMRHVEATSPLFPGWLAAQDADLAAAREAIAARDLPRLGTIAEENCLRMHATSMAARPPVLYWLPATLALMRRVVEIREAGTPAYFTIDAGPQVKVLCASQDLPAVAAGLRDVPGVVRIVCSGPGPGVSMVAGEAPWR